jgi:hypothetical protein
MARSTERPRRSLRQESLRARGENSYGASRARTCSPRPSRKPAHADRVIYVEAGDEKSALICFEEGLRHGRRCRRGRAALHDSLRQGFGIEIMRLATTLAEPLAPKQAKADVSDLIDTLANRVGEQQEDEAGERFWIYRTGDGEDATTGSHHWFLHGIFG